MPDACVNLLFNQHDTRIAGVTQLHTTHTTLNLGRSFHYVGIQFFPGVWRGDPDASVDHYVGEPYEGELALVEVSRAAAGLSFDAKTMVFSEFVETLLDSGLVARNPVTATLSPMDDPNDPNDPTAQMRAFGDDFTSHGAGGALVKLAYAQPGPGGSMVYFLL